MQTTAGLDSLWLLLAAWLLYGALHSLLASLWLKRHLAAYRPGWMPAYRLFFNTAAVILLLPPAALTLSLRGEALWRWEGPWQWLALGLQLAALIGFVGSLRHYDLGEFAGLKQLRQRIDAVEDQESLHISPFHRHVRHPWYFLALVLIWTQDMDPAFLTSAIVISLYFWIGSLLEERKLVHYHGTAYAEYRRRVPGLIPLPWRRLSEEQARELLRKLD